MMDLGSPRCRPGDISSDTVSLIKGKVIQQKATAFTSAQTYASQSERLLARSQCLVLVRNIGLEVMDEWRPQLHMAC